MISVVTCYSGHSTRSFLQESSEDAAFSLARRFFLFSLRTISSLLSNWMTSEFPSCFLTDFGGHESYFRSRNSVQVTHNSLYCVGVALFGAVVGYHGSCSTVGQRQHVQKRRVHVARRHTYAHRLIVATIESASCLVIQSSGKNLN